MDKKYINIQNNEISSFLKDKNPWYLPGSGLWGDRYMDEKKDVLTEQRNIKEISIIKGHIKGKKDILDIPCGYGRISNALAAQGYRVFGVDNNKYFIDIARKEAEEKRLDVQYLVKDMVKFKSLKKFDAVLNIFTSLGYYDSEEKNQKVIDNLCKLVKPDGLLIIETINPLKLLKDYKNKITKITSGGTRVLFENFFDYKTSTNVTKITEKYLNGKINKIFHCIRLYFPHELINICLKNNLILEAVLNDGGRPQNIMSSSRIWLIFKKQK
ncbi:MAG: Methyltransferase type 11 [Candidatus Daviesbacteria bacterium GW2011_GWB1_41_5]|uniref:Methyltransferase type 11 n=1 Tax=Candidatus Daviesbacteria bacterium GW2011_GWB1_41_5 TaxID=1618429 RepID=A0A0G0YU32_9BACT|nr:MAG: Methyltransferase type 11 [Candidatus Daviesbacteria bacterium GW2011_GWB1_41_5]